MQAFATRAGAVEVHAFKIEWYQCQPNEEEDLRSFLSALR
jgi:hypothetical protein